MREILLGVAGHVAHHEPTAPLLTSVRSAVRNLAPTPAPTLVRTPSATPRVTATSVGQTTHQVTHAAGQALPWELFAIILAAIVVLETLYIVTRPSRGRADRPAPPRPDRVTTSEPQTQLAESTMTAPPAAMPAATDNRWQALVQEDVLLYDELDGKVASMDPAGREIAIHVCKRLREILERSGVEVIAGDSTFNALRHIPEPMPASAPTPGSPVLETLSPGFAIGRRVLRRATVRIPNP